MSQDTAEAIARLEEQAKFIREDLQEIKELSKRVSSLEHTRTWVKAVVCTAWAAILFLGWDTIKAFLTFGRG